MTYQWERERDSEDNKNRKDYTAKSFYFILEQGGCSFGPDTAEIIQVTPHTYSTMVQSVCVGEEWLLQALDEWQLLNSIMLTV